MTNSEKIIAYIKKGVWVDIRFKSIVDTDEKSTAVGCSVFSEIMFSDGQVAPPHVVDGLQILHMEPIPIPYHNFKVGNKVKLIKIPDLDHKDYKRAVKKNLLNKVCVIKTILKTPTGIGYEVSNLEGSYGATVPQNCLAPYFKD